MKVKLATKDGDEYTVGIEVNGGIIYFHYDWRAYNWRTVYPPGKSLADYKRSTFITAKKLAKKEMERLHLQHNIA